MRNRSPSPRADSPRREPLEAEDPDSTAARSRRQRPLRNNQERLGVNPDHKTETMRKRRRGTFP